MSTSPATMDVIVEVHDKTENRPVMPSSSICGYLLQGFHIHMTQRNVHINVYCGTIYNSCYGTNLGVHQQYHV